MKKKNEKSKNDRFSEENILEILVTAFVILVITFFFVKIMYF